MSQLVAKAKGWTIETYREVIDNAGVGLFQTRLDGTYVFANDTLARMLGYLDADALFRDNPKVGDRFYANRTQRDEFQALMAQDGHVRDYLIQCRKIDGTGFWVSETSNAMHDVHGTLIGYVGALIDVTARVQAEDSFAQLFDNMTEGVCRTTPDGRLVRANPALVRLMGFETERALIESISDLGQQVYVDPSRRQTLVQLMTARGEVAGFESEVHRVGTGETIWISETLRVLRDEHGVIRYYEGTVRDITEQRASYEQLRIAKEAAENGHRSKARFLANISHELRTPLNSIIGFSEVMRTELFGALGSEKYRGYIEDMHNSASMLLRLIDDILEIAKQEAGQTALSPESIELPDALDRAIRVLRPRAEARGVILGYMAPPPAVTFNADPNRLNQILVNLAGNAIKFNQPGGHVRFAGHVHDDRLEIKVIDDGPGIDPRDVERLFQPFERSRDAQARAVEGTGLGLPLARDLARLHGGDVLLTGELGKGTTATVILPLPKRTL
ncbi:PAS domain-containing sensor histidine kinase [Marivibrio halodurans]|uniref:histidine kinase n=1 Tax=Marivibrio halodurans TaxID=2039722 RepID=A0A8J7V181_9PROT|nr:PAS domain-containing sensor histidine kinase [Marivibrio halodurans]